MVGSKELLRSGLLREIADGASDYRLDELVYLDEEAVPTKRVDSGRTTYTI